MTTVCIRSPEDLHKHNLMGEVWLDDGKLKNGEGRLFGDKPMTLIFDSGLIHSPATISGCQLSLV